jgi:hypothetical protein
MKDKSMLISVGITVALAVLATGAAIPPRTSTPSKCRTGSCSPSSRDTKAGRPFLSVTGMMHVFPSNVALLEAANSCGTRHFPTTE